MKKKTLLQVFLGMIFSGGLLLSISPTFSLYKNVASQENIGITYNPSGTITYKLEANKTIYLDTTYEVGTGSNSGVLTCGDGATTFTLSRDGDNYITDWEDNTQTIYCTGATTFTWKKYINDTYHSTVGSSTINYEGVYTISPTTDGNNTVSLGKSLGRRSIYLDISSNTGWTSSGAWFTLYYWGAGYSDTWICGRSFNDANHYRFFVDEAATGFKIVRMNPDGDGYNWDREWNNSGDLTFQDNKNCWSVTGWGDNKTCPGSWGNYNV